MLDTTGPSTTPQPRDSDVDGSTRVTGEPDVLDDWRTHTSVEQSASNPGWVALWTAGVLGSLLVVVVAALAGLTRDWAPDVSWQQALELVALMSLYAAAYRTEFVANAGSMVPTQPVLVALLVTGPLELVPLAVVVAILVAGIGREPAGGGWYGRAVQVIPAWHSLAPVAILLAFGLRDPSWSDWPVLALALAGQFALDALTAVLRMASLGVAPRALALPLSWTFGVDTLMAVIGAGLALGAPPGWPRVVLAVVPSCWSGCWAATGDGRWRPA